MRKEIVFWDKAEAEYLQWTSKDEAIENILEETMENTPDKSGMIEGELELCGFVRKEIGGLDYEAKNIVETLIEKWDEEYGGYADITDTDITEEMIALGKRFVKKMSKLYVVWQCDIVCREKISIRKWVEENRPDWLTLKDKE